MIKLMNLTNVNLKEKQMKNIQRFPGTAIKTTEQRFLCKLMIDEQ